MPLKRIEKEAIVAKISEIAARSYEVGIGEYRLTASEMNALRSQARKQDVYIKVVPNTLAKLAFKNSTFECLTPVLTGPLLFAFALGEAGSAARLLRDFIKEHNRLVVKYLAIDGKLLPAKDLNKVANLPSRPEALALLMQVMKAPVGRFSNVLKAPHLKFVQTLLAIAKSR